jgi:membrane associated rhomboid family serine protease
VRPFPSNAAVSFGPGPMTPAVKLIIFVNAGVFLLTLVAPALVVSLFGLTPSAVLGQVQVWQLVTYLFVHSPSSFFHILFNMLAVWMFGVELERRWGTPFFAKFYFVCGVGAGLCTMVAALLPFEATARLYFATTIGASGAVYGLLMAWALIFPHREILFMFIFPLKARMFVLLVGAIAFFSAMNSSGGPVASIAHLGGLLAGWIFLQGPGGLLMEFRRQLARRKMDSMRRRFNVHKGGRDYWGGDGKVH